MSVHLHEPQAHCNSDVNNRQYRERVTKGTVNHMPQVKNMLCLSQKRDAL